MRNASLPGSEENGVRTVSGRGIGATIASSAAIAIIIAAVMVSRPSPARVGEHTRAEGALEEAQEQQQSTDQRLDALREAVAAGEFGVREPIERAPAPGWTGEQLMDRGTDDWEPAVAADPNAPFVYLVTTRYGEPKPCPGNCPIPHIALEISRDGGRTWSEGRPLCPCKGSAQYDPIIEVVPDTGDVYALWMRGFNTLFQASRDHGRTWSPPVSTYGNVSWTDKPALATSDNGKHVYVSWNGPTGGDPWMAQSHDFGETWTQTELVDSRRYFFAYDADVLRDGTVIFSESSLDYSGPAASAVGSVSHHAFISRDRGRTWRNVVIDRVEVGVPCTSAGCYGDFYDGHTGVSADANGDLVFVYDGAVETGEPRRIYARRSTDEGRTWSRPVVLSRIGENATAPAVEATGDGDVRAWYYQTNDARHRWNVWYRSSADGGRTWSSPELLSDADSGARYKHPEGFEEVYGDYGEIAITSEGKTFAAWGEGFSWLGPGGTWFNLGR